MPARAKRRLLTLPGAIPNSMAIQAVRKLTKRRLSARRKKPVRPPVKHARPAAARHAKRARGERFRQGTEPGSSAGGSAGALPLARHGFRNPLRGGKRARSARPARRGRHLLRHPGAEQSGPSPSIVSFILPPMGCLRATCRTSPGAKASLPWCSRRIARTPACLRPRRLRS